MDEQKNPQQNTNLKSIHTFATDMADAVREQEASVIKIVLAEKQKREMEEMAIENQKSKNRSILYLIGSIVMIALAIWGVKFLIQKGKEASAIPAAMLQSSEFVHSDQNIILDATSIVGRDAFTDLIQSNMKANTKEGSITSIVFSTKKGGAVARMTSQDFIDSAVINMPGTLEGSFTDKYMIGVYRKNSQNHLFIIFQSNDYNQSFAGMLQWEPTILSNLFKIYNINVSSYPSNIYDTPWGDKIVFNKDSRVLRATDGKEILRYMFLDLNKIIITDDQDTIAEVLQRLVTQNARP